MIKPEEKYIELKKEDFTILHNLNNNTRTFEINPVRTYEESRQFIDQTIANQRIIKALLEEIQATENLIWDEESINLIGSEYLQNLRMILASGYSPRKTVTQESQS